MLDEIEEGELLDNREEGEVDNVDHGNDKVVLGEDDGFLQVEVKDFAVDEEIVKEESVYVFKEEVQDVVVCGYQKLSRVNSFAANPAPFAKSLPIG